MSRYPPIQRSTLVYIPSGALFGRVEGMVLFGEEIVLCVQEYLNFELGVIEGYGHEVSRANVPLNGSHAPGAGEYCRASYPHKEKLYWYDSFPHPNTPPACQHRSSSQARLPGYQASSHSGTGLEFHQAQPVVPHR